MKQVCCSSKIWYTGTQLSNYATSIFSLVSGLKLTLDEVAESIKKLRTVHPEGPIVHENSRFDELKSEIGCLARELAALTKAIESAPFNLVTEGLLSYFILLLSKMAHLL